MEMISGPALMFQTMQSNEASPNLISYRDVTDTASIQSFSNETSLQINIRQLANRTCLIHEVCHT